MFIGRLILIALGGIGVAAFMAPQPLLADSLRPAGVDASQMTAIARANVEKSLDSKLQRVIAQEPKLPGQKTIVIATRLSLTESQLFIDLGRDAVPDTAGAASERQCHTLVSESIQALKGIVSVQSFTCTYGGKDIFHYRPDPVSDVRARGNE